MSSDYFHTFVDRERQISVGVALTTATVKEAIERHELGTTSAVILGRLLTSTALIGLIQRRGPCSLQIVGDGQAGQSFADVTEDGHLRGYMRGTDLSFPTITLSARRSVAAALGRGSLSVIRQAHNMEFSQSTTDLASGEVDVDVEAFLRRSEQTASSLACEVIFDHADRYVASAGVLIQALPDGDGDFVNSLGNDMRKQLCEVVGKVSAQDIVNLWLPDAVEVAAPQQIGWRCRCSYERVIGALRMLGPAELASMVDEKEDAEVTCDFCRQDFTVPASEVEAVFLDTITAQG